MTAECLFAVSRANSLTDRSNLTQKGYSEQFHPAHKRTATLQQNRNNRVCHLAANTPTPVPDDTVNHNITGGLCPLHLVWLPKDQWYRKYDRQFTQI